MLSLVTPAKRAPTGHPIRRIKEPADAELAQLSSVFDEMYSGKGRPSNPPERLLKAQLLMALYSVRSERQFCERLDYDLLFRGAPSRRGSTSRATRSWRTATGSAWTSQ